MEKAKSMMQDVGCGWHPFGHVDHSQRLNRKRLGTGCYEWLWSIAAWDAPVGCNQRMWAEAKYCSISKESIIK